MVLKSVNLMQTFKILLVIVMVACAVVITALLVRRELFLGQVSEREPDRVLSDSVWQVLSESHVEYEAAAARPVTVVEYFDYECPFCGELQPMLSALEERYSEDITLIYRHYPAFYHIAAYDAAIAAECAANQGYFKVYHNMLFANQPLLPDSVDWNLLAQMARLPDLLRFSNCVSAVRPAPKVKADMAMANMFGINGIPTLIVNGTVYTGLMTSNELDSILQRALRDAD